MNQESVSRSLSNRAIQHPASVGLNGLLTSGISIGVFKLPTSNVLTLTLSRGSSGEESAIH